MPFCFSTGHLWKALMPFWLSTDYILCCCEISSRWITCKTHWSMIMTKRRTTDLLSRRICFMCVVNNKPCMTTDQNEMHVSDNTLMYSKSHIGELGTKTHNYNHRLFLNTGIWNHTITLQVRERETDQTKMHTY